MDESLRIKIIGDPTGAITSLNQVNAVAAGVAGGMKTAFTGVGEIIKSSLGWLAGFEAIKKGLDLASSNESLLRSQTALLKNQGALGVALAGGKSAMADIAGTYDKVTGKADKYSTVLASQAMALSMQTGISDNAITQAQNLLIPNQDLLKLFQNQKGAFADTVQAAANLSGLMHTSMPAAARTLSRVLADPAKKMSGLTRYGFSLTQTQLAGIKGAGSLINQQKLFIKDINTTLGGVAQAGVSPMERLANDFQNVLMQLGKGLLPIVDAFATVLANPTFIQGVTTAFTGMAQAIAPIAQTMGDAFGSAVAALTPLIQVFTQGVVPAIMTVVQPFITAVGSILGSIGKIFTTPAVMNLVTMMTKLANVVVAAVGPSLKLIADTFDKMSKNNGPLTQFFTSLTQSLQIMAPLLPAFVNLLTQLLVAFLPIMQTMLPSIAFIVRIVADVAKGIANVVDFIAKMIGKAHGLFKIISLAIGVVLAVWFTRSLFLNPVMAAIAQLRSFMATLLKVGTVGKDAFDGMAKGEKGFAGRLKGYQGGVAKAKTYLLQQQVGRQFAEGDINIRGYRREMRKIQMQGPAFEEEMKRLRRTSNPIYGRAFGQEGGGMISRLQTMLLGPNKKVLADLMAASQRFEQGEDENDNALSENTNALLDVKTNLEKANGILGGAGNVSANAEIANAATIQEESNAKVVTAVESLTDKTAELAVVNRQLQTSSRRTTGSFLYQSSIGGYVKWAKGIYSGIDRAGRLFGLDIKNSVGYAGLYIQDKFQQASAIIVSSAQKFGGLLATKVKAAFYPISVVAKQIGTTISEKMAQGSFILRGVADIAMNKVSATFDTATQKVKTAFSSATALVSQAFETAGNAVQSKFLQIDNALNGAISASAKILANAGRVVGDNLYLVGSVLGDKLKSAGETVKTAIGVAGIAFGEKITGAMSSMSDSIRLSGMYLLETIGKSGSALVSAGETVALKFMYGADKAVAILKGAGSMIGGGIGKLGSGIGKIFSSKLGAGLMGGLGLASSMISTQTLDKIMPKNAAIDTTGALQGASIGMMFGPWGAAIGAAIGLMKSLYNTCKPVHNFVHKIGTTLKEWWTKHLPTIKKIFEVIGKTVMKVFGFIRTHLKQIAVIAAIAFAPILWPLELAVGVVFLIVKHFKGFMKIVKDIMPVLKVIGAILLKVAMFLANMIIKAVKILWDILKFIFGVFKDIWNILYDIGKFIVTGIIAYVQFWWNLAQNIAHIFVTMWDGLVNGAKAAWGFIKRMFHWIENIGGTIWDGLYNGFVWIANKIIGAYNDTVGLIPGMSIGKLKDIGGSSKPAKGAEAGKNAGHTLVAAHEAVKSLKANKGSGTTNLNVHPNAVTINISGNADKATTEQIKKVVDDQFKELHRTLKSMGR